MVSEMTFCQGLLSRKKNAIANATLTFPERSEIGTCVRALMAQREEKKKLLVK